MQEEHASDPRYKATLVGKKLIKERASALMKSSLQSSSRVVVGLETSLN